LDVKQRIEQELASHPVLLFMKGSPDFPQCGFSAQAVDVLRACGTDFDSLNILEEPELREALKVYSSWPTFPQLYVKGELIGGSDILVEMYQAGELQPMLAQASSA
jgi:monothiol glutaredoxin